MSDNETLVTPPALDDRGPEEPETPSVERLDEGLLAERADHTTRFQPGHFRSWKDGSRSRRMLALELPEQAEASRCSGRTRRPSWPTWAAPSADVARRRHGRATRAARTRSRLSLLEHSAAWATDREGAHESRLDDWLQVVDRLQRSAVTLGLERRVAARALARGGDDGE